MSSLASIQRAMAELLRAPSSLVADAQRAPLAAEIAAESARLTPSMQLDVYREQFFLRHLDVLREDFSSIAHLLGDDAFDALGRAYLQAFPPRTFTLRDLGRDLAGFVESHSPWASDELIGELARVEWAFVEAFDAPAGPSLDVAHVARVPEEAWPAARLVLQPFVQRLSLRSPAHDYRLAVRAGAAPRRPEERASYVVVFRGPVALECLDLETDAYQLLDALAAGTALGEACERVARASGASESSFQEKVGAWFQQWTALGFIRAIDLAP